MKSDTQVSDLSRKKDLLNYLVTSQIPIFSLNPSLLKANLRYFTEM